MGLLDGRVAVVTGGGRGQGRSHALTLAGEGADVVVCDVLHDLSSVPYPMSGPDDLDETVRAVTARGARCVGMRADVRSSADMSALAETVLSEFGRIDILVANAGIASISTIAEMTDEMWDTMISVNLGGVFRAMRAVVPEMLRAGYGRIVATSSVVGRQGSPNIGHYVAAKWGVIGLVKSLALEVAAHGITVNAVCPTSVDTRMIRNEAFERLFLPDVENPTLEQIKEAYTALNPIPVPWVEPDDVSRAVLFLASDRARYITGETVTVAAGWNANNAA
jgi:SDR family mycofactocin-dependent oxidoreductase